MILSWLIFVAVVLITYAGFVKFAAFLFHYTVSWKSSFLFALIVLVLVIVDRVLAFHQSVPTRIIHAMVLLLVLVILGSWFFSTRGMNPRGATLGWGGGLRLTVLAFAMMAMMAFAIVLPAQVFLSRQPSSSP